MYLIGQGDDIDILSINFYGSLRAVIKSYSYLYIQYQAHSRQSNMIHICVRMSIWMRA